MDSKHGFYSPLRYPGGKGAIANFVKALILRNKLSNCEYFELYAGGAGVAWSLLLEEYVTHVHINDISHSVHAFWKSVLEDTDELCKRVSDAQMTMREWRRQRSIQNNADQQSTIDLGFSTFYLNRTNRSGILGGGIIGGKEQTGAWKMDARFNKVDLVRRIERIASYRNRISLYRKDSLTFIKTILPKHSNNALVYLDPPYFVKGSGLYEDHYSEKDHASVARAVKSIRQPWIVSYDNVDQISRLYKTFKKIDYSLSYSAQDRYAGSEAMFFSSKLSVPAVPNPAKVRPKEIVAVSNTSKFYSV